jgi:hypothetical protein
MPPGNGVDDGTQRADCPSASPNDLPTIFGRNGNHDSDRATWIAGAQAHMNTLGRAHQQSHPRLHQLG